MIKKGLCLIITDKCNASCDICCFCCSPKNSNVMTEELMIKAIDEAADIGSFQQIGFSGGEPFLYFDLLKKGITYAKEKGFATSVATNGFWGSWDDKTLNERFSSLPLDQISLSYDAYHAQYISGETFSRALSVCKSINISYSVGIGETKEKKANDFFRDLDDQKYLMNYYIYPFMRAGRALELPEDIFYMYDDSCPLVCREDGLVSVRYDGAVFPCCVQSVFNTSLCIGNINSSTLGEILSDSKTKEIFRTLKTPELFTKLGEKAAELYDFMIPEKCVDKCEICSKIFGNKSAADKLLPYITEINGQFAVKKVLER